MSPYTCHLHSSSCDSSLSRAGCYSFPFKHETRIKSNLLPIRYRKEACSEVLAKIGVLDEFPFKGIEEERFIWFFQILQLKFIPPSMVTMTRDVLQTFVEEKPKLKFELEKHCQGVCLTIDVGHHC